MKSILEFSRKHPIITAVEAVLFCMTSLLIIRPNAAAEGYGIADVLLRFLLAIVAGAFLHAVSGDKTFDCCDKKSLYVIKSLCPFWIMGIFLAVLMLKPCGNGGRMAVKTESDVYLLLSGRRF